MKRVNDLKASTYCAPRIAFNWDGGDAVKRGEWPQTPVRPKYSCGPWKEIMMELWVLKNPAR